jgi:hypothetical protein
MTGELGAVYVAGVTRCIAIIVAAVTSHATVDVAVVVSACSLWLQERLVERGSKVKALVAHPGGAATGLQPTTAANSVGSGAGSRIFNFFANFLSQSAADGALPLLAATVSPDAQSGDFYRPGQMGLLARMTGDTLVGPPVKLDWANKSAAAEKLGLSTSEEGRTILWECSEQAIGRPFFA